MMECFKNSYRAVVPLLATLLLFTLPLKGEERGGEQLLSLEQSIEWAMEKNFSITIAENRVKILENNLNLEPFLPSLYATSRLSDSRGGERNYTTVGDVERGNYQSSSLSNSLSLSWRLFDGFAMFATRERQEELLKEGEFNLRSAIENMILSISSQYYKIITLHNQVELLTELLSISTIRYNQALTRYNIGSDSGLEYKQAKIYLNSDSSALLLQRENLKNAYIELYKMINIPLESSYRVRDTIVPEEPFLLGDLLEFACENNTHINAVRVGEAVASSELKLAKGARYPTLDLSAGYNYNFNRSHIMPSKFNEADGFNWGLSLSIPLFNGGEINRRVNNARLNRENAQLFVEQAKVELQSEIRELYNLYRNHLRSIEFEEESREAAYLNLEAAMEMYRLGSLAGIEFRDYQHSYLTASDRKLKALYETKLAEIRLRLLSGTLF